MVRQSKCLATCQRCVAACPHGAIQLGSAPRLKFDRAACDRCDCMECVKACSNQALRISGRAYTPDELLRILSRDQGFWGSQGGVTFTGGEPLLQAEFLLAVLQKCRSCYMHTALETCAHVDTDRLLRALQWIDWLFVDIKHMDSTAHRAETGVGNELILSNLRAVASAGWEGRLILRVPIIPGFNDRCENLEATAAFVRELGRFQVNLLPFHRLGSSKYEQLGLEYKFAHQAPPAEETMLAGKRIFEAAGLPCHIGFDTPF